MLPLTPILTHDQVQELSAKIAREDPEPVPEEFLDLIETLLNERLINFEEYFAALMFVEGKPSVRSQYFVGRSRPFVLNFISNLRHGQK